jgi:hypothetical protein
MLQNALRRATTSHVLDHAGVDQAPSRAIIVLTISETAGRPIDRREVGSVYLFGPSTKEVPSDLQEEEFDRTRR